MIEEKSDHNQSHTPAGESSQQAKSDTQAEGVATGDGSIPENEHLAIEDHRNEELEELRAELTDSKEQLLRIQAEMQNLRRRAERDVENAHKYALEKFAADLLPVVDNLERALGTIQPADEGHKAIAEGVELTLKSFLDVLRRFKVETIDPHGEPFDPEKHQAMSIQPNPEMQPNTVMNVFQKGYSLNGRLIRPAMVVVSRAPQETA